MKETEHGSYTLRQGQRGCDETRFAGNGGCNAALGEGRGGGTAKVVSFVVEARRRWAEEREGGACGCARGRECVWVFGGWLGSGGVGRRAARLDGAECLVVGYSGGRRGWFSGGAVELAQKQRNKAVMSSRNQKGQGSRGPFMQEPDTYRPRNAAWEDAMDNANRVLGKIADWNAVYGRGDHNQYSRSKIQAYTLIKTLPECEPWESFRRAYWRLLYLYVANVGILGGGIGPEGVPKEAIRWKVSADEVLRDMRKVDTRIRERGMIEDAGEFWRKFYERLGTREEAKETRVVRDDNRRQSTAGTSRRTPPSVSVSLNGSSAGSVSNANIWDPDYVPEDPSISTTDSGYYYDPLDLD
ncbi:hypothetical protein BVRB_6g149080 [Beta vulgaris subsp. vulgaris]|nr:hypothetical protein BVRB_6g149080 [Beta vulgaris subsp. vulgaris]